MARESCYNQVPINSQFKSLFLDNMFELEGIGFWDLNLQTMEVNFSPQIYTMLGYEPKEAGIHFDTWMERMHPEDKIRVMPVVERAAKNKEQYSIEFRLRCNNGEYKWISSRAKSYKNDSQGNVQHVMGVHVDVDAVKKNERSLKQTKSELEKEQVKLQERNEELSCIFKATEIVRDSSLSLGEMMQELAGIMPKAFPDHQRISARITYQGKSYESENFQQGPSKISSDITFHGEIVGDLEVFCENELSEWDHKRQFVQELAKGLTRTVERIRAETRLSESEHKFRTLFETMAEGVVYHDKAGKIITANPAAEWILASSLDEMHGRTSEDPKWKALDEDGKHFPGEAHPVMVALRTGQPVYGKIMGVYNRSEEKYHWIKVNAIPQFHGDETEPYQVYASFEDITREYEANIKLQENNDEIESMNEELKESIEEAQKADKAKTEFLATMSHELRTPLNGVIGFSEILRKTTLEDYQREFLDIVIQSANNMLAIISDIMDFTRIDSNKLQIKTETVDLQKLVEHTLEVIKKRADEKDLKIITDIETPFRVVTIDPLRFNQVLLNLLTNAVKFTDNGSVTVVIREKLIDKNQQTIKLHVSVRDTGLGIKEEHQKTIFDAFSQADMSNSRKFGGTGLGLAISKQLLDRMGSDLQLTSVLGKGSHFYFDLILPYYDETVLEKNTGNKPLSVQNDSKVVDMSGKKILIVEDDPINMKLSKAALSRFSKDMILLEANNGEEAYNLFLKHHPDLILMDIIMPELDGYQATAMIRQLDGQIPIIAMTAKALEEDKEKCLAAGMNEYITKPISLDVLKKTVENYLS